LARATGDWYTVDEVDAAAPGSKAAYAALTKARLMLLPGSLEVQQLCKTAKKQLGNSPASLFADAMLALATKDVRLLQATEENAKKHRYLNLYAWTQSARGLLLLYDSQYVDALAQYDDARRTYVQMNDAESVVMTDVRRIGILRVLGDFDKGWPAALEACRNIRRIPFIKERNLLLGEAAAMANALGHPLVALRYAEAAVVVTQKELAATPPEDLGTINRLQGWLSVALRRRATYELRMGQYDIARRDLDEATRLTDTDNPELRRSLDARLAEVHAQALMHVDPAGAAQGFTEALALSKDLEYRSFRASLYKERADAEKAAHQTAASEDDLRAAIAELNAEEANLLKHRVAGTYEEIVWRSYFSRFQETYHALIRQLIEEDRGAEAFRYADRARAFEPLSLASKLTPPDITLEQTQSLLQPGTFLIEYSILEDRTYAWVISNHDWRVYTLPVSRETIERWAAALQRAVPARDLDTVDGTLLAAYDALLTAPMASIKDAHPRLIFVPDGAMDGIPFAALRNPATRRYVIQDAPVSVNGSAALYALSLHRDQALPLDSSALLFGDPRISSPPLLAAKHEVDEIAKFYEPRAIVFTGSRATIDEFVTRAGENAIVHVAAHAVIDAQRPSHSALLFAQSANDSGVLDAVQLLDRLKPGRTRLVVLGTCSSAAGLPVGPEGVAPLVRPLIAKGIPTVVGTLWAVDDATAKPLLVSFHQHYREGNDAAVAMQLAQNELLRNSDPGLQSVLAWAPFQVIGHGTSPFAASRQ